MYNFSLNAEKPDEWNILSPNFDHWVHMGKGIRSGDKESRIYLQTFKLRWPEEYHQT